MMYKMISMISVVLILFVSANQLDAQRTETGPAVTGEILKVVPENGLALEEDKHPVEALGYALNEDNRLIKAILVIELDKWNTKSQEWDAVAMDDQSDTIIIEPGQKKNLHVVISNEFETGSFRIRGLVTGHFIGLDGKITGTAKTVIKSENYFVVR